MQKVDLASVQSIQSVLDAPTVSIFVAGREDLASRASLAFVADQARDASRPGFALGEEPEKFIVRGGLHVEEVDALFRAAAGRRAEHAVRMAVQGWARGVAPDSDTRIPVPIHREMQVPVTVSSLTKVAEGLRAGVVRAYGEASGARPIRQSVGRRL